MIRTEDGDVVAREHDVADTFLSRARGMMLRRRSSLPDSYALVFEFSGERRVGIHMLFVFFALDVLFLDEDGVVVSKRSLRPWIGFARARASAVVELPAGTADAVDEGDRLVID